MEKNKSDLPDVIRTDEKVAQDAVNQTGFGWFNLKIYILAALISLNIGFGLGNIGLIMPSAACDFKMTTLDKGRIGVSTVLGMMCGPYFWAGMADMKGRKFSLIISLFLHGFADGLGSIISNYWGFIVCKFFNGFSLGAQLALLFTYLGEFQPCKYRDKILSLTELPWSFGLIITASLGWAIIPLDINYQTSTMFFFKSWNLFLLISSLLAPSIAIWLMFLPETPKYLAETGEHKKLIDLLSQMYHENTGLSHDNYLEQLRKLNDPAIDNLITRAKSLNESPKRPTFRQKLKDFSKLTLELLQPPHIKNTLLVGVVTYCITSAYFTMVFWLPEIFQRFSIFEERFPDKSASVCTVSQVLYSKNGTEAIDDNFEECSSHLDSTVFFHNLILGLACLPPALWLPLCVDRLGFKIHLTVATLFSSLLVFGLLFVNNSTQNLILSCLFEALSSISITIIFCTVVELYPTHLRVIASAFATFIGRIGAVVGISLVGYLIDDYCVLLVAIVGTHLSVATILGFFIPIQRTRAAFEKKEMEKKSDNKNNETQISVEMNVRL
ncbi:hypothetical protein PV327_001768 [Microctonus hyperodae]|uniref:Major facilitator superfamily (MFS) profile domain-containing protein n=1 Tax=Microctonus hyperodae TaxID=165561 RepID=A0AA39FEJ4_MICHY|nr:hypothetical protein PV327_001768 [Microctonus hyperodae]